MKQETKEVSNVSETYLGKDVCLHDGRLGKVKPENCKILGGDCICMLSKPKEEPVSVSDDWKQFEKDCDNMEKELWNEPTGTPPVSVEEAATQCINQMIKLNPKGGLKEFVRQGVMFGVNWQKEQDKELIRELLEALQYLIKCNQREYMKCEIPDAIAKGEYAETKANNYLNQ
jgi:hypothetical protein